jgi:hypothetical protein
VTEVLAGTVAETARLGERVLAEVEQVIVGKPEAVKMVLLGVLASGHILIEDLPAWARRCRPARSPLCSAWSSPGSSSPPICCPPT